MTLAEAVLHEERFFRHRHLCATFIAEMPVWPHGGQDRVLSIVINRARYPKHAPCRAWCNGKVQR